MDEENYEINNSEVGAQRTLENIDYENPKARLNR